LANEAFNVPSEGLDLVITISGLHGTGKSTYAKAIAESFRLRHISAGVLFRQIADEKKLSLQQLSALAARDKSIDRLVDKRTREEVKAGSLVVDGQLSAWIAGKDADIKIFLSASDETRFRRIASRDGVSLQEAENLTIRRERLERARYKRYYDIDIRDLSIYDIVLNTESLPVESNIAILEMVVREYINNKR
jgi:cytidylate kinase